MHIVGKFCVPKLHPQSKCHTPLRLNPKWHTFGLVDLQ